MHITVFGVKVADAEAAGIDTTAAFISEYTKFRNELAAPYLRDKKVEDALLDEAYSHMKKDVNVSHIMIPVNRSLGVDARAQARMDSIRAAIVAGEISFEDAAVSSAPAWRLRKQVPSTVAAKPAANSSSPPRQFFGGWVRIYHPSSPSPGQTTAPGIEKCIQEDCILFSGQKYWKERTTPPQKSQRSSR